MKISFFSISMAFYVLSPSTFVNIYSIFLPIVTPAIFTFSLWVLHNINLGDLFYLFFCLYLSLHHQGLSQCYKHPRCSNEHMRWSWINSDIWEHKAWGKRTAGGTEAHSREVFKTKHCSINTKWNSSLVRIFLQNIYVNKSVHIYLPLYSQCCKQCIETWYTLNNYLFS